MEPNLALCRKGKYKTYLSFCKQVHVSVWVIGNIIERTVA